MSSLDDRRVFMLATSSPQKKEAIAKVIEKHIDKSTCFCAEDGNEALFKIENYPPHICILDASLPKKNGFEVADFLLAQNQWKNLAVIIISPLPDKERLVEQVVTGQLQFLIDPENEEHINTCIARALNFVAQTDTEEYKLHFLVPKEVLFEEGDIAQSVFIVKTGVLNVLLDSQGIRKIIGEVSSGEFVGEMAYFNRDKRSATVEAQTDCELIEIPIGKLDMVLFSKPVWSKALIQTLTKRLKHSNNFVKSILKKEV